MKLAACAGIEVPPCALVRIQDGSLGFLVRRFDRLDSGGKRDVEDFCQLAEKPPKDKYVGSAELCARLVHRYAGEPLIEARRLFRRMVFAWWTGNGDMHLKNFALLRGDDGRYRMSPAYDLLCTRLLIADDRLALPVGGGDDHLTRTHLLDYAAYCRLPARAAERVLADLAASHPAMIELCARSYLDEPMKQSYRELLDERLASLKPGLAHGS